MLLINRPNNYLHQSLRFLCLSLPPPPTTTVTAATESSSLITLPATLPQFPGNLQIGPIFETLTSLIVSCKLNVSSKLFSRSSTSYFSPSNENVSLFDASVPATLPIVNRSCLKLVIKSALALHCQINPICSFDREHNFNPVHPTGYRLVQTRQPLAFNGYIQVPMVKDSEDPGHIKTFNCKSIHLEEDCGSIAVNHLDQFSGINLNSCGLPIVKFVFPPTNIKPKETISLINELLLILRRIGATNNRLEERTLSIEAKIQLICDSSPCKPVTIKSCNSHITLANHIAHEIGRQKSLIKKNQPVPENYLFLGRLTGGLKPIKSTNYDTRTMVEPSIPPFHFLSQSESDNGNDLLSLSKLTVEMPILPEEERSTLINQHGLSLYKTQKLIVNNYAEIFIKMKSSDDQLKSDEIFSFVMNVVEKSILIANNDANQLNHCPDYLVQCYHLLKSKQIIRTIAIKMICGWLRGDNRPPQELIAVNEWSVIDDDSLIEDYCKKVIIDRSTIVFLVKRGEKKFIHNLAQRVKVASKQRIPEDKIIAKLWQLIDSIDKQTLSSFVATRNKPWLDRPKLFADDNS